MSLPLLPRFRRAGRLTPAALGLAIAGLAAPLAAEEREWIGFETLDRIEDILSGHGEVTRDVDGEGVPMFQGRMDGMKYSLLFYNCEERTACETASFSAYFDGDYYLTDLERVNRFNYEYRFGKASVDPEGDLALDFSFSLLGGLPRETFEDTIEWWRAIMTDGAAFFDPETQLPDPGGPEIPGAPDPGEEGAQPLDL
ncbi:YbjN domain-containing protein [Celeribacter indicus]|uniref:YbjN domain-containing protein n=1 Tax=Celeribacter indicus TaxID=1208324 RepID=A0A0B5E5R5_9RHOB|nr:YbjN domain-containing protein [Celeribacter indicus]AJE47667.1 hypothetical protein P73_2952 [Celeribacter indicus]SDW13717.1 Putative sensory transduction regulator [Celeribacter indicus]